MVTQAVHDKPLDQHGSVYQHLFSLLQVSPLLPGVRLEENKLQAPRANSVEWKKHFKKTCWFAIGELFLGPPLEQETGGLVTLSHSLLVVNQSFPSLPSMSFSRMAGNKGSGQMIQTCA